MPFCVLIMSEFFFISSCRMLYFVTESIRKKRIISIWKIHQSRHLLTEMFSGPLALQRGRSLRRCDNRKLRRAPRTNLHIINFSGWEMKIVTSIEQRVYISSVPVICMAYIRECDIVRKRPRRNRQINFVIEMMFSHVFVCEWRIFEALIIHCEHALSAIVEPQIVA